VRRRGAAAAVLLALLGLLLVLAGGWGGGRAAAGGATVSLVVAARPLDAGTVVQAADVEELRAAGADALANLAHAASDVVGRRLAVAVPAGLPLSGALLTDVPPLAAGRRLLRLAVDAASAPPDLAAGVEVEVLAGLPDGAGSGRVVLVATARVVEVAGGSSPIVTLNADAAGAARLVWAQAFAKSLRLLVRGASGDAPPPDVAGLGT
jgi:SAF domain